MLSRRRNSKRLDLRGRGGRFEQPTLAKLTGTRAVVCPHCRGLNLLGRKASTGNFLVPQFEDPPATCGQCGLAVGKDEWS